MTTLSWDEIEDRAAAFRKSWEKQKGAERQQAQNFIRDFLSVFGIENPMDNDGEFEHKCPKEVGDDGYIDYFLPKKLIVEMKSKGKDLSMAFEQVKDYVFHLPADEMPELVLVCDFNKFELYHRTTAEHVSFQLKDIRKYIRHFANIAGYETQRIYDEQFEVNVEAAMKMARIHDALREYGYEGHELEVYLVRLLFCMFAEDTGIFPKDAFLNYNDNSKEDGTDLSERIGKLFEILDMSPEKRSKRTLLSADLLQFGYVDGGLFRERLDMPEFNEKMRQTLIDCCKFDWSKISPAIFGSMFQGIMDPEQRREIGAHYTSEENILKVINPLFMDDLWNEFERVKATPKKLEAFHEKIANLRILDPACGCGNFLITTYKELRRLELEIIKMKYPSRQRLLDVSPLIKVSIDQFYGLEILDFPCEVARTGMWLVEHLMNREVGEWFGMAYADLPLKRSAHIIQGNALRLDWQELLKDDVKYAENLRFDYIIGTPPYIGARYMSAEQKDDLNKVFGNQKNAGNLDYVTCWVKQASDYMTYASHTRTAFVMTNSVTQGETPANLWQPLFDQGLHIDYAWRTFKWWNEGRGKAAVHCVIVGFSQSNSVVDRYILSELVVTKRGKETKQIVKTPCSQINGYLVDAPCVSVMSRPKPLCDVPEIGIGNKPIDDGNYLFLDSEKEEFVRIEPASEMYFKRWYGSDEFINNRPRWCLWLGDCEPGDLRKMPECLKRVQAVRAFRLASKSEGTRKLADKPTRFHVENMPKGNYIVIPEVSSEKRKYIPMGYMSPDVLCSNLVKLIPNATLYHFGILTSSVHMAWMRAVCGRLKSDYRYSKDIVYNNFPWPDLNGANGIDSAKRKAKESDEDYKKRMEAKISLCAEEILRARDNHPNSSLADLYDPLTMPPDLRKAHKALDKAVMELYGYMQDMSESEIVADLMVRYQKLIEAERANSFISTPKGKGRKDAMAKP